MALVVLCCVCVCVCVLAALRLRDHLEGRRYEEGGHVGVGHDESALLARGGGRWETGHVRGVERGREG